MMMSSRTRKEKGLDADNEDSNSVPSKPEDDEQSRMRWSETSSSTTNEPSSASATVVTASVARHPSVQSTTVPTLALAAADATAAAAPAVRLREKKPRRAGFRDEFLPMLRVMLDRESQTDRASVQWSVDGSSFIVTDHKQFEEQTIPTYFDKAIAFSSFLRKLYRWGFKQLSSRRTGHYEFGSPTFKRLDTASPPAVAAAAAAADSDTSIQVQQQPTQAPPLLQVAMAQNNQQPATNLMPIQAGANAIAALLSNTQRQINNQQHHISSPSQTSVLNQSTCQSNACTSSILQNIVGSNQQPLSSKNSVPSQQPVLNHANQLNTNLMLQQFQQMQLLDPSLDLLDSALRILVGSQAHFSAQPSLQSNAVGALMSLYGMTSTTPPMSQRNIMDVQTLLLLLYQLGEDERQRRAQADAIIHDLIIATTGLVSGGDIMVNEAERQHGIVEAPGSNGGQNTSNMPLGSGTTVSVPCRMAGQPQQAGTPLPSAGNLNIQADSLTTIFQPARRGEANDPENIDDEDSNEGGKVDGLLSPRKRKSSPDEGYGADDDDSWNKRLRPRKISPGK